jgi:hypothetical protein
MKLHIAVESLVLSEVSVANASLDVEYSVEEMLKLLDVYPDFVIKVLTILKEASHA